MVASARHNGSVRTDPFLAIPPATIAGRQGVQWRASLPRNRPHRLACATSPTFDLLGVWCMAPCRGHGPRSGDTLCRPRASRRAESASPSSPRCRMGCLSSRPNFEAGRRLPRTSPSIQLGLCVRRSAGASRQRKLPRTTSRAPRMLLVRRQNMPRLSTMLPKGAIQRPGEDSRFKCRGQTPSGRRGAPTCPRHKCLGQLDGALLTSALVALQERRVPRNRFRALSPTAQDEGVRTEHGWLAKAGRLTGPRSTSGKP